MTTSKEPTVINPLTNSKYNLLPLFTYLEDQCLDLDGLPIQLEKTAGLLLEIHAEIPKASKFYRQIYNENKFLLALSGAIKACGPVEQFNPVEVKD